MTFEEIKVKLNTYQRGRLIRCGWKSSIESAAARKQGIVVTKESEATVRLDINYSNIKSVKLARAEKGDTAPTRKIWFRHLEDVPAIIEHLNDTEKKYLCMYPITRGGNPRVKYFINGVEATKEEVQASGYVNASEWNKSETAMFTIPLENVRFVGKEVL